MAAPCTAQSFSLATGASSGHDKQTLPSNACALYTKLSLAQVQVHRSASNGQTESVQEVPVRILNSRVSFARTKDANCTTPDGDGPAASSPPPLGLTLTILDSRVQKMLEMVESGTFTIHDLALELYLSPSYLRRLFKQQTGVSLGEWLNEQRLQRAADLLSNSYLSVKEITHTIGYGHASSFTRAFQRRFRQAPASYRKTKRLHKMLTKDDLC
jgi:AraC-like DNA-binding protein